MALKVEGVVDRSMDAEEALGGSSRLEPLHLALSSQYRLMRVFRPIILPKPLFSALLAGIARPGDAPHEGIKVATRDFRQE
jgi:hypothetical protein